MNERRAVVQVLESPNSSYVWIRYMAFHIGVGEIGKARAVAERALTTIHFRSAHRLSPLALLCSAPQPLCPCLRAPDLAAAQMK
jgi:hypothetical protein